jgi:hypothetical protein
MNQSSVAERIRRIFLQKSLHVSLFAAADLLGLSPADLRAAIDAGEIDSIATGVGRRVPRQELIAIAYQTWSRELIERVLGADASAVLPEALRLAELRARIPRYQVAMLKYFACRDQISVSAVLTRELEDTASAASEELAAHIPGFAAALAWPESPAPSAA